MNKITQSILNSAAVGLALVPGMASAQVSSDASATLVDNYVINRGFQGSRSPSLQLGSGFTTETPLGDVRVGYWGNIELDNEKGQNDITEHDLLIDWSKAGVSTPVGDMDLGLGYAKYWIKGEEGLTIDEITMSAAINDVVASMFVDVSADEPDHGFGGRLSYNLPALQLGNGLSLSANAGANFNSGYFTDKTGFAGVTGQVTLNGPEGSYIAVEQTEAMGALDRESFTVFKAGISK
jgi:hypothetical protein